MRHARIYQDSDSVEAEKADCSSMRLNWAAANKMLFDEMTFFLCDYDILADTNINGKGEVVYE